MPVEVWLPPVVVSPEMDSNKASVKLRSGFFWLRKKGTETNNPVRVAERGRVY